MFAINGIFYRRRILIGGLFYVTSVTGIKSYCRTAAALAVERAATGLARMLLSRQRRVLVGPVPES
jgi:MFS-type transporter involved in bile tolerance (Atg22 family)